MTTRTATKAFMRSEAVKDGPFPSEKFVKVKGAGGEVVELLVDDVFVGSSENNTLIRVKIVASEEDRYVVLLPGESFGPEKSLVVNKSQLVFEST